MLRLAKGTGVIPVNSFEFRFFVITSKEQFDYLIKHNKLDDVGELSGAWEHDSVGSVWTVVKDGHREFVMLLKNATLSVIIHECVHVVHDLMELKGVPIDMENTEVMAYLTSYVTMQVLKHVNGEEGYE